MSVTDEIAAERRRTFDAPAMQAVYDIFRSADPEKLPRSDLQDHYRRGFARPARADFAPPRNSYAFAAWAAGCDRAAQEAPDGR